jgi:hypothetical protein
MHLASIEDSALHLRQLDPFIGALTWWRARSSVLHVDRPAATSAESGRPSSQRVAPND